MGFVVMKEQMLQRKDAVVFERKISDLLNN